MRSLSVKVKTSDFLLTLPDSHKRVKVYNASDQWIDTKPRRVSGITDPILAHMLSLLPVSKRDESGDTDTWVDTLPKHIDSLEGTGRDSLCRQVDSLEDELDSRKEKSDTSTGKPSPSLPLITPSPSLPNPIETSECFSEAAGANEKQMLNFQGI